MTGRCESCGRDDELIVSVRRAYVTIGDWDREESIDIVETPEVWCGVCRELYPHQPLDET